MGVPQSTKEQIDNYRDRRVPPGGFLEAVLSNNLVEAALRADSDNGAALCDIVKYCYRGLPPDSWGNSEKIRSWLLGETIQA